MTEISPDSQPDTATAPAPDPAASGPEVEDHLPCVLHKTGALHSIVCWGEKIITWRKCHLTKDPMIGNKSNDTSRLWQFVTITSPSCSPWTVLSDILLDFCSVHKMSLALFIMNIIACTILNSRWSEGGSHWYNLEFINMKWTSNLLGCLGWSFVTKTQDKQAQENVLIWYCNKLQNRKAKNSLYCYHLLSIFHSVKV